ncbi:MAG: ABC transporter substrate-binding protein [Alphaproteobacteria bacterium]|nr:ABC transporter substrate-binding protein [Alphaproteobacteria bacterium]
MTRSFLVAAVLAALAASPALVPNAFAQDKVTKATNWKAQAEHGGYYQAVATGIYAKYGLDVTIRQGGPQVDNNLLMLAGRIDFNMGGNSDSVFAFAEKNIPFRAVAAIFQKDPQILMSHPGVGNDSLAALKGKKVLISKAGVVSFYPYLKKMFGFTDEMVVPYTFNIAPFLADKQISQQGYATSEPYAAIKAGVTPVVHLLADNGYRTYSTTIEVSQKLIDEKPDLVQRFVDASILGWKDYLYGNPAPGNALIKKDNPDMTDDQIAFSIEAMKKYGIVDSGDAKTLGIGAMTDQRWKAAFDDAQALGVYAPGTDYTKAYTTKFVNKKVGL